jgi:ribosomal protein L13E/preprotein translocase subunit SecB
MKTVAGTYGFRGMAILWAAVITLGLLASGCPSPTSGSSASSAKAITSFVFTNPAAVGSINEDAKTISVMVPSGTDRNGLAPEITHTGASISPASGAVRDFSFPVQYIVTAENGSEAVYTVTVTVAPSANNAKAITGFSFGNPAAAGIINEGAKTISVTVPYGTDPYSLAPEITHTGANISPGSWAPQDFSSPVYYTVTAENGTTAVYTVTVTVAGIDAKAITGFSFADPAAAGSINEDAKTISVTVPYGTDRNGLVPAITHTGTNISPGSWEPQNFSLPVEYTVSAWDGTTAVYTVTVTVVGNSGNSSAKAITGFSFADPPATGNINEDAKTISVTVPYGTSRNGLVPAITHTGAGISPASGMARDFSSPVQYTVSAENGTTAVYTVTVTVAGINAKAITGFSFADPAAAGIINEDAKTISVTVPYGTSRNGLVPAITHTGASISPVSGVAQNFNSPVQYTVSAGNGTTAVYTVTVTVAGSTDNGSNAKAITGFSFANPAVAGSINEEAKTISVTVPYGTDRYGLVPSIIHTGTTISPASGAAQNFSSPVQYTVSAENGTTAVYIVTVTVAGSTDNGSNAKAITGFSFANLAVAGIINEGAKIISVTVPYGTDRNGLVPSINHTGTSISPASGAGQDFSSPVYYTVSAGNGTTAVYTVTVTVAGGSSSSSAKAITGFSFADLGVWGSIDEYVKTISVTVPYGTNVYNLVPAITHTGASISPASWEPRDFSIPVYYTVMAENGTTAVYTVNVTLAGGPSPSSAKAITGFSFADLGVGGSIDEYAKTISVTVPYGTNLYGLVPTIIHTGVNISPASGEAQDFSYPVYYTVTAEDGTAETYTVNVTVMLPGQGGITLVSLTDAASGELPGWPVTINKTGYPQTETLYVAGTFDTCRWRVDGTVKGTGGSFALDAADYIAGTHQLSLEVTLNGVPYSKSGTFIVVP